MIVYHGTSKSAVGAILQQGIRPWRLTGRSNWSSQASSSADLVYLTDSYPGFYADAACEGEDGWWAILEVDLNSLNKNLLLPDENFVFEFQRVEGHLWNRAEEEFCDYYCSHWEWVDKKEKRKSLLEIRDRLDEFASLWRDSLKYMGLCAYRGTVPSQAITRGVLFDARENPALRQSLILATFEPDHHEGSGHVHRATTRWLMGDKTSFYCLRSLPADQRRAISGELRARRGLLTFPGSRPRGS